MNLSWRIRTALLSAAKGWACLSLLVTGYMILAFSLGLVIQIRRGDIGRGWPALKEWAVLLPFWPAATGLVTLATTILFILPYISLVNAQSLLKRWWRIYVESAALVSVAMAAMAAMSFRAPGRSLWDAGLGFFLVYAISTSTLSSAFFMRSAKKRFAIQNRAAVSQAQ